MKHKIFVLILLTGILESNAFAQPVIKAQRAAGGESDDELSSMYLTKDEGFIVGGSSKSDISGEKTQNSRGDYDYWIVKYDSLYNIEWDKTIGGSARDGLGALQQTSDGGYILGGSSYSNKSGEKTENSRGFYDYWVVKLDSKGNVQWDKTIGGSDFDFLLSLQQTSDGGYILGGSSWSNRSGEKTENSRGQDDYWVVKLNSSGNIQWDKTIGGNGWDDLSSLQQTRDGGYILGGWSHSNISGEKTENSRSFSYDYWVLKLDSKGNIQWDKTIGGKGWDQLSALQQTSDGGYILGGLSDSKPSFEKTQHSWGSFDYWVVKLGSKGNIQWDKTIGGNGFDELNSLQQTSDSGYILGGRSASGISGKKTENNRGGFDYWVVKLNSSAKIQWDKTIGGKNDDWCYSIKETGRNRYLLGGSSLSKATGDKHRPSRGGEDYWIVGLFNKTGSRDVEITSEHIDNINVSSINKDKDFIIYPNPAKDILHVQINGSATVSLTDQSGKVLLTKTITGSDIINTANLKPGLYYLKNATTGAVKKVIVSK